MWVGGSRWQRAVPVHPGTLVWSAAGLPGLGRRGDDSGVSLLFGSRTPSFGHGGGACPVGKEARGLGHPRRELRSQNLSWSGVNGGPEKLGAYVQGTWAPGRQG